MLPIAGLNRIALTAILLWLGSYHTLYAAEFSITAPPYPQDISQPPLQFEFTAEAYCSCTADNLIMLDGFAHWQTAQDRLHLVMAEYQLQPDQLGHQIEIFAEVKAGAESGIVFLDNSEARFQHRDNTNQFFNGNLILGRVYAAPFDRIQAIFAGSDVTSTSYEVLGVEIIQHQDKGL